VVDCCSVLFPNFDFVFLFDQSSGHGKRQKDGLCARLLKRKWGGATPPMHASRIVDASCLGPYPKTLSVRDEQSMMFTETDQGPFYVNEPQRSENKYDQATGEKNKRDLKKSELIALLQSKIGLTLPSSNSKTLAELQTIAATHGISTQIEEDVIIQGRMNKPKGLLQILWE